LIELHSNRMPNSQKVVLFLEESGLEYRSVHYDIMAGEQLTPEFRKINPNNKLPAIVDYDVGDSGPPFPVFESGAILIYLAEKTGMFLPKNVRKRSEALQWLIWQVAGLGPMFGQAGYFTRYAPATEVYGAECFSSFLLIRTDRAVENTYCRFAVISANQSEFLENSGLCVA
jgi:GSH-dependent disulfide-bond oxidoreductase